MASAPASDAFVRSPSRRAYYWAIATIGIAFIVWVVVLNVNPTIIVSAVDRRFTISITLIGVIIGVRLGLTIARDARTQASNSRSAARLLALLGGLFGMMIGSTTAYRLADIGLFWQSNEPITSTVFPIRSIGNGRGGPYLGIGSKGETTAIRISDRDYALLTGAVLKRPWPYCVTLRRQANYKAVRIWIPRRSDYMASAIYRCPVYARW